jgi:guanylate kinase
VLAGPSGVGKSTVVRRLREFFPQVWVSVSVTTRAPRPGEVDGVHYRFVDRARFAEMVERDELIEHAEFGGNLYGTPSAPVLEHLAAGIPVILEIDLQGARQVRRAVPQAQLVFLAPPSWEVLVARLVGRGTEAAEVVEQRLRTARVELAAEPEFDATVVNTSVEEAAAALVALMGLSGPDGASGRASTTDDVLATPPGREPPDVLPSG